MADTKQSYMIKEQNIWLWCSVWKNEKKIPSEEWQSKDGVESAISWVPLTVNFKPFKERVTQELNQVNFITK